MSQKQLETVIRELKMCIDGLANKVDLLEAKICEQSALIIKLMNTQSVSNTANSATRKSLTLTSAPLTAVTATALQRPVRSARICAAAAKADLAQNTATKKTKVVKATTNKEPSGAGKETNDDVTETSIQDDAFGVPNVSSRGPKPTASRGPHPVDREPLPLSSTGRDYRRRDLKSADQVKDKHRADEESGWQNVKYKRFPKRKVLTGIGEEDNDLQSIEPLKYLQAWSFRPETTVDNVRNFVNKISLCEDYYVEKRDIRTDRHAAFVIGCPESLFKKLSMPSSWPSGVKISEWWFQARPRVERGVKIAECSATAAASPSAKQSGPTAS